MKRHNNVRGGPTRSESGRSGRQARRTRAHFQGRASKWSENYRSGGAMVDRIGRFADVLSEHVEPGASVLDLGCGTGEITFGLTKAEWHVTGCDASTNMLALARRAGRHGESRLSLVAGDLDSGLPFQPECFDAVVASSVFEYLDNPESAFAALERTLKPGGWVMLTVPDMRHPVRSKEAWMQRLLNLYPIGFVASQTRWRNFFDYLTISKNRFSSIQWLTIMSAAGFDVLPIVESQGPLLMLIGRKSALRKR